MEQNRAIAIKSILESEGFFNRNKGEMCDPADSGGFTVGGMTVGNFCEAWGLPKVADPHNPPDEIKAQMRSLSKEHFEAYYLKVKLQPLRFDQLPPGVDLAVADVATLHGPGKAAEFLRKAISYPPKPNLIDESVAQACWDNPDWGAIVQDISLSRRDHYERIIAARPANEKWRKGWFNRTARCESQCMELLSTQCEALGREPLNLLDLGKAEHD
jgi:lysozyme family protein